MNVFRHELKMNRRSTAAWILVLVSISALMLSFYPIIREDLAGFMAVMDNFPPAMKAIMGMVTENFSTPLGYYCFALNFAMLFASIQAMNIGIGIVSKETRDKTADFLLTKPVSRTGILFQKSLAAFVLLTATSVVYSGVIWIALRSISDEKIDFDRYLLLCLGFYLLQLIFCAIGLLVSVSLKKIKSVLSVSLGLVFFFYAISAFAVTSESDKLRYLTPFQYFKPEYIVKNGSYETAYVLTGLVLLTAATAASFLRFRKKEIHAV